jgi:hypothetical protein
MNDVVFLTVANEGYVDLTRNLIENFQQKHLRDYELTVACLDDRAFSKLAACPRPNVRLRLSDAQVPTRFCSTFDKLGFARITSEKFRAIIEHLDFSALVWYVDGDIVFRRDPLPHARSSADVLLTSDARDPKLAHCRNLCTGSMVLRSCERTRVLLERVVSRVQRRPNWNDQRALNRCVLHDGEVTDCRRYPHARIDVLAPELFPNGHLMFSKSAACDRPSDPVAIHANYRIGKAAKIKALRRANCWYL